MNYKYKILISAFLSYSSFAQVIPPERITDWSKPGSAPAFVPKRTMSITIFGADSLGVNPSDNALKQAIAALNGSGKIVVPKGTFLFNQTIELPDSVILEGQTEPVSHKAISTFKLAVSENHGIKLAGGETKSTASILGQLTQGQTKISISEPAFVAGDFIRLHTFDDSALVESSWGIHATGQILKVIKTEGNDIWLDKPLRRTYSDSRKPEIYKIVPRKQVHIRSLVLQTQLQSSWQTSPIQFYFAANCSVSGIESYMGNFAHIEISYSSNITVENSYFKDAFAYGSGGAGYGVALQYTSGDCYIHANIFEHLRHSILLQAGANGNVIAYNYSLSPFWTGTILPSNSSGDLVLHGNYVYMNLFEGNVVQNIVIDNSHGINGPYNTFFRNRAELYGIVMNSSPASNSQNFIGNQVVSTSVLMGNYSLQGSDHFQYGNVVKGIIVPSGTQEPDSVSMFHYPFSSFYTTNSSVPPIQTQNWQNTKPFIEAQCRYLGSSCVSVITGIQEDLINYSDQEGFQLLPNPFTDVFMVKDGSAQNLPFKIYDTNGYLVMEGVSNKLINGLLLQPGVYFVKVLGEERIDLKLVRQ